MAENPFKSKLKRKRLSAEDLQADLQSRGTQKKSLGDRTAEPGRSAVPAAVWWSSEQLPAVEALWASAVKSALPYLQDQSWDSVPDLPEPSSARAPEEDDQRWCDLSEDVPPLPEPSTRTPTSPGPPEDQQDVPPLPEPSTRTPTSPGPSEDQQDVPPLPEPSTRTPTSPGPPEDQQDVPTQTQPGPDPPERGPSSLSRTSLRASLQSASRRRESVGGDKERREGDTGDGQLRQGQRRVSNRPVFMEEEEEQTGELEGDGGALKSCPMCMLLFPAGFTQMDRDGHLAQCLSEVNDDITW